MEKFNKKTLIIGRLIFIGLLFLVVTTFGQLGTGSKDFNPPQNLSGEVLNNNDVNLFWTQPSIGDSAYLHWDSGENEDQFGFLLGGAVADYAVKWDPEHITFYDGWTITKMRFFVANPTAAIKLKIWEGEDGTEIYSQDIPDYNIWEWTEITLDEPVTVNSNTQLWAGLNIDMEFSGIVMGSDAGPAIIGYGNLLRWNGYWSDDQSGTNWNIQIQVEKPETKETDNLLGYNVYRDDEQLNEGTWTSNSYVDGNLLNNTYEYYVTAVYDDGESDPSNIIEVVVEQTGILVADSMALVDLYNECNGVNWWGQDEWLEGPVSEWYGVTTEGNRVTKLWRQSNQLTGDIPASIGNLTALEELHLESNTINSIPENIGDLVALKELWLGWNPLVSVPSSIGDLSNLEQLHLGSMELPLNTLPENIGNLGNLNWLALGGSGLNSLPESFGNLTALESCFIWGNYLTELPENFGNLTNLDYLSLYENQLTSLPESFGELSSLRQLFLEFNELTSLPENFGDLDNLFKLRVEYNQLSELPEGFGDLSSLSYLYAYQNQLVSLPESFGSLESLDSLWLFSNSLTSLPETFGNLSDLQYLVLENNQLTELPESFGSMATIEEIFLKDNELESLPENFGNMTELFGLVLSGNNLTTLPESLYDLQSLKYLYAHQNQIEYISENIGNLPGLLHLAMDQNEIVGIPESITDLSALEYISLNNNNISEIPEGVGDMTELIWFLIGGNNISEIPSSMFDNQYDYLWVQENVLQFGSLEPFVDNVLEFEYYDQAMIGKDTIIDVPYDQIISYTIEVSGDDNIYKWYKDGSYMPVQTTNTLYIENASNADVGVYVLKVTNTTVIDLELVSHNFTVSDITGLSNSEYANMKIYPNPVSGNTLNIIIDKPEAIDKIIIVNGYGQVLRTKRLTEQSNSLDISGLNKGMYIVKVIYYDGQNQSEKILIK